MSHGYYPLTSDHTLGGAVVIEGTKVGMTDPARFLKVERTHKGSFAQNTYVRLYNEEGQIGEFAVGILINGILHAAGLDDMYDDSGRPK